jgi:hypothetical protein
MHDMHEVRQSPIPPFGLARANAQMWAHREALTIRPVRRCRVPSKSVHQRGGGCPLHVPPGRTGR